MFVARLSCNAEISFWRIVWVTTNCYFLSDVENQNSACCVCVCVCVVCVCVVCVSNCVRYRNLRNEAAKAQVGLLRHRKKKNKGDGLRQRDIRYELNWESISKTSVKCHICVTVQLCNNKRPGPRDTVFVIALQLIKLSFPPQSTLTDLVMTMFTIGSSLHCPFHAVFY